MLTKYFVQQRTRRVQVKSAFRFAIRYCMSDIRMAPLAIVTKEGGREEGTAKELKLVQRNLDILAQQGATSMYRNVPVSVVCIAGGARLGKSTQLGTIMQYLRHKGWTNSEWMKLDVPLTQLGFDVSAGDEPVTEGILLWLPSFLIEHNGQKRAVVLLDAEGINDMGQEGSHASVIFALALACSSTFVYVVDQRLAPHDLDVFKAICDCMEIANSKVAVSKRLVIRVRDYGGEYRIGSEGGAEYLKWQQARGSKTFESYWESLKKFNGGQLPLCFLTPRPDETFLRSEQTHVVQQKHLNQASGSGKLRPSEALLKDMGAEFLGALGDMIEKVMHPNQLPMLSLGISSSQQNMHNVHGTNQTLSDLAALLKELWDNLSLHGNQYITGLAEALASHYTIQVVHKCLDEYKTAMKQELRGAIPQMHFEQFHEMEMEKVLELLHNKLPSGSSSTEAQLKEQIDAAVEEFRQANRRNIKECLDSCKLQALADFDSTWLQKSQRYKFAIGDKLHSKFVSEASGKAQATMARLAGHLTEEDYYKTAVSDLDNQLQRRADNANMVNLKLQKEFLEKCMENSYNFLQASKRTAIARLPTEQSRVEKHTRQITSQALDTLHKLGCLLAGSQELASACKQLEEQCNYLKLQLIVNNDQMITASLKQLKIDFNAMVDEHVTRLEEEIQRKEGGLLDAELERRFQTLIHNTRAKFHIATSLYGTHPSCSVDLEAVSNRTIQRLMNVRQLNTDTRQAFVDRCTSMIVRRITEQIAELSSAVQRGQRLPSKDSNLRSLKIKYRNQLKSDALETFGALASDQMLTQALYKAQNSIEAALSDYETVCTKAKEVLIQTSVDTAATAFKTDMDKWFGEGKPYRPKRERETIISEAQAAAQLFLQNTLADYAHEAVVVESVPTPETKLDTFIKQTTAQCLESNQAKDPGTIAAVAAGSAAFVGSAICAGSLIAAAPVVLPAAAIVKGGMAVGAVVYAAATAGSGAREPAEIPEYNKKMWSVVTQKARMVLGYFDK